MRRRAGLRRLAGRRALYRTTVLVRVFVLLRDTIRRRLAGLRFRPHRAANIFLVARFCAADLRLAIFLAPFLRFRREGLGLGLTIIISINFNPLSHGPLPRNCPR